MRGGLDMKARWRVGRPGTSRTHWPRARRLKQTGLSVLFLLAGACTFGGGGIFPSSSHPPLPLSAAEPEVPFVPTPRPAVEAMLDMAAAGPGDYVIDLGSGDGRIPIAAAQRGARALGVDIDPARVAEAVTAARLAQVQDRVRFVRQDLFDTPIREATIVTLYLLPDVNLRLRPRLLTELRPGSRIVSHNFTLGDWAPDESRTVGNSTVHLWTVPAVAAGRWTFDAGDGRPRLLELEQRFQTLAGRLDGRPLAGLSLVGRRIAFSVEGDPSRHFHGLVGDRDMEPDPELPGVAGWSARRD